jgi:signal-transduction protein with cAMP-binding, CBS, and nucleotidyltransferase domain
MDTNHLQYSMLFEVFSRFGHTLPDEVKNEVTASTYLETYKKDEIIHPYKQICENVYFITGGLAITKYRADNKERILWFMIEGDVFISVKSFFYGLPSENRIVALEDTQCIVLPKARMKDICDRHPSFRDVKDAIIAHYYSEADEKMKLLSMTAAKRCAHMYDNYRRIYERVNNYRLAEYLGMEQQTFSKVQAKMLKIKSA